MHSQPLSFPGGYNEPYERLIQDLEVEHPLSRAPEEQLLVERLLAQGFDWEESVQLIDMRTHLYESAEMQERMAADSHMLFARWLYENGEMRED
jgi:hypothetical protein